MRLATEATRLRIPRPPRLRDIGGEVGIAAARRAFVGIRGKQGFSYGNPLRMQAVRFTEKSRSLRVESEGAKARIDRSWNLRETGPNKHVAHPLSVRWALPNAILRMSVGHGAWPYVPSYGRF